MTGRARFLPALVGLRGPLLGWLCAGAGAWQAVVITGFLIEGHGSNRGLVWISGVALLIGLAAAVFFGIRACAGERASRADWWMSVILTANPVWFGAAVWFFHRKPSDDIITLAGFVLPHAVPALLFSIRIRDLLGLPRNAPDHINPNQTTRILTLMFLSILIGGWTAGLAGLVYPIADPFMFDLNGDYTVTPHEKLLGGLRFASGVQWLGFALGFLAGACVVAPLMRNTKLEQSVPVVFLLLLVVGAGTTLIDPLLAIVATVATLIVASLLANRLFDLGSARFQRSRADSCPDCGYDLTGSDTNMCPECGRPDSHETVLHDTRGS